MQEMVYEKKQQKLCLTNRRQIELTGVSEVISFDQKQVVLDTDLGRMVFFGEDFHVKRLPLERGEIEIEGLVRGIDYQDAKEELSAGKFFGRLFR